VPFRRLGRTVAIVTCCFVVLSAFAVVAVLRAERRPHCVTCAAGTARYPGVVVDSDVSFGFHGPAALTVAGGRLWVTNSTGNSVTEFGWRSSAEPVVRTGHGLSRPRGIVAGGGRLWVANATSVTELNVAADRVVGRLNAKPPLAPGPMALAGTRLWVGGAGRLSAFSAVTGHLLASVRRADPRALAVSDGRLWVASAGTVTELDARTGALIAGLGSAGRGAALSEVASPTRLWVADGAANTITEFSTTSGQRVRVINSRLYHLSWPSAMVLSGGSLWVTNALGDSVTRIDAATGRLAGYLSGGRYGFSDPTAIAAYRGRLWVANRAADSVTELVPAPLRARPFAAGSAGRPSR
jgi:DNA-binding beta-propeller fold protein YncE